MSVTTSPFDAIPEADPAAIETRPKSRHAQQAQTVELMGDSGAKKKRTDLNPVQRRWFEKHGWAYYRAEKANAWGAVNQDMWGCIDYLAVHEQHGFLLVQTCIQDDVAKRERKIQAAAEIQKWLRAGGRVEIHGWHKPQARWEVRRHQLWLECGVWRRSDTAR